jgi:AcrR family transcriptional regulator
MVNQPEQPANVLTHSSVDERIGLSRDRILDAAITVMDRDGFDALTMRRIAAELGVAPMALYTYFRNKDDLLDGMVDRVAGDVLLPDPDANDWKHELTALAGQIRQTLLAHPGLVAVLATHEPFRSPNVLRAIEGVLALLRRSGFDDASASNAFYPVFVYTTGFVSQEVAGPQGIVTTPGEQAEVERQMRLQFEALPIDRFPNVIALAPHLARCNDDESFEFGLRCLLTGIEAQVSG